MRIIIKIPIKRMEGYIRDAVRQALPGVILPDNIEITILDGSISLDIKEPLKISIDFLDYEGK